MIRPVLFASGMILLGIGIIGIFVPLLPTTPFVLLAAWCFFRSSPKFHHWLVTHPMLGPIQDAWVKRGAIPRSARFTALAMNLVSLGVIWWVVDSLLVRISVTVVIVAVLIFILTRPD